MKKNYFPLIIVLVLCAVLVAVSFLKEKNINISHNNDEIVNEQVENTDNDNKTESETIKEEVFNQEDENNEDNVLNEEASKGTKKQDKKESGKGLFLGMDDSNFLVIFMSDENGSPKEYRFAIDRSLNFENSDVEIGDSVSFEYITDSKDTKTITKISKSN